MWSFNSIKVRYWCQIWAKRSNFSKAHAPHYLLASQCVDVCSCISLCTACISMYRVKLWIDLYMFARINLKVFACIGLHCVHWPVLHVMICIDIGACIDWLIHAKDLHNTYQYLHKTYIPVQCHTAFQTTFIAKNYSSYTKIQI